MTKKCDIPQDAGGACENTDRHLWPQVSNPGDPYESIHVTKDGAIGINVGGNVIVMPLRAWHAAAGGTPGRGLASGEHHQLLKFYDVETLEALVDAQARHIECLQGKLPPEPNPFRVQRPREG